MNETEKIITGIVRAEKRCLKAQHVIERGKGLVKRARAERSADQKIITLVRNKNGVRP